KENINAKKKTNGHSGQLIKNGAPTRDEIAIQAGFSVHQKWIASQRLQRTGWNSTYEARRM
ncbi:MAG: hypothetical protein JW779_03690, partial [Candidatus Thorarchaeota archaeon]|nr:hypothetical protein [Candidatus Thorarchaeota archaeon]